MLKGTKKKTAKKATRKRRNPDVSIREIEDYLLEDMKNNPNHYPPASANRAIKHFKLDIGNSDLEDNWVTDLAWQIGEKIMYDKGKTRARKAKKGSTYGFLGIGNSPFRK
jgi:hypothetical protein